VTAAGRATAVGPVPPAADAPSRRRTYRPDKASWPLWLFTAGLPISYAVGIHGVAWMLPALVFGARILANPSTRFPRSSVPLVLLVVWILLSASMLPSAANLPLFAYRWSLFAGCLAAFVWLVNVREEVVPSHRIVDWLAAMWIVLIVFGYVATVLPNLITASPFQLSLGPIGKIGYVARITEWRFAETQKIMGIAVPRPAAPFGSANSWGSAVGILTPFFVRSWLVDVDRKRRRQGIALLVLGVYPILVSVNRGLWISLTIGLVYFAARKALRGKFGALAVLGGGVAVMAVLLVATSAGDLVSNRLDDSGKSNDARSNLYELAWQGTLDSPLVGNGAPVPVPGAPPEAPPIGTHGLFWYLMFVHGFVGLFLFLAWVAIEVFRSGRVRTPLAWWTHLSLVVAVVEVPYYGLLPHVVLFGIVAGLAHREVLA
jgi:hypothetical protein